MREELGSPCTRSIRHRSASRGRTPCYSIWQEDDALIWEVHDIGRIGDPMVGRRSSRMGCRARPRTLAGQPALRPGPGALRGRRNHDPDTRLAVRRDPTRTPRGTTAVPVARVVRAAVARHHGRVSTPGELSRFVSPAQDASGTYAAAVAEPEGTSTGHWMRFVFPQIAGLGWSAMSRGMHSRHPEAAAYLAHPVLGPRLLECARALTEMPGHAPVEVLGPPDDQKLHPR